MLAPREWTQTQALWANDLLAVVPPGPVLELCSGVGHLGLLAVHGTDRRLVCVDVDPVACAYAVDNALWIWIAHDLNPRAMNPKVKGFVQAQSWFQDLTPITMQ